MRRARLWTALLIGVCPGTLWAQAAPPTEPVVQDDPSSGVAPGAEAGDIVVTAQRRTQRLQDVPVSVTVATGQQLQDTNVLNLESVSIRTSNVRIAVAPVSDFVTIRGVGSSLNLGFEQSVGTFVDGLYRGRSRSTRAALFDIERVEILKGPQSTFFGNNVIAGVFNIATRKPGDTIAIDASAFYAPNTDEYTVKTGFTVPLSSDLSIRLAGQVAGMNGYIRNVNLDRREPRVRDAIGRASLRWTPGSIFEYDARVDVGRSRNRGVLSTQVTQCPPPAAYGPARGSCARFLAASGGSIDDRLDRRSAANPGFYRYDFVEAAQTGTVAVGDSNLILTSGYFHHEYDLLNDGQPVPAALGGSVVGTSQGLPLHFLEEYDQFSQEVRFQSPTGRTLEFMAGAYYAYNLLKVNSYQGVYNSPVGARAPGFYLPTTPIASFIFNREEGDTKSVFGAVTLRLGPSIRLNGGLRYSDVEKSARRTAAAGTAGSIPGASNFVAGPAAAQALLLPALGVDQGDFTDPRRSDDKLMPSASIQYDIFPDVMAYASYAEGFKAGGYSVWLSKSEFGPETVDSYEIGIKSLLFNRRLTFNVTGFLSDYADLQETSTILLPSGAQQQFVGNIAQSRAKGIEVAVSLRAAEGLTISSDVAYLDSRYTDFPNAPCTVLQALPGGFCVQDLSDKRRAFSPKYSGNLSVDYITAVSDGIVLRLNGNGYFSTRFFQQPVADAELAQAGYVKFDARIAIGAEGRRWELAIVGKNLTNERTASFRQGIPTAPGSIAALEEPNRTIGVQLSMTY